MAKQASNINSIHSLSVDANSLINKPGWEGSFDRILLDAPCSGLGTLSRHPDARWRITQDQIDELVVLQSDLLECLLPLLRSVGRIVYATCTIHPKENVEQIAGY